MLYSSSWRSVGSWASGWTKQFKKLSWLVMSWAEKLRLSSLQKQWRTYFSILTFLLTDQSSLNFEGISSQLCLFPPWHASVPVWWSTRSVCLWGGARHIRLSWLQYNSGLGIEPGCDTVTPLGIETCCDTVTPPLAMHAFCWLALSQEMASGQHDHRVCFRRKDN